MAIFLVWSLEMVSNLLTIICTYFRNDLPPTTFFGINWSIKMRLRKIATSSVVHVLDATSSMLYSAVPTLNGIAVIGRMRARKDMILNMFYVLQWAFNNNIVLWRNNEYYIDIMQFVGIIIDKRTYWLLLWGWIIHYSYLRFKFYEPALFSCAHNTSLHLIILRKILTF